MEDNAKERVGIRMDVLFNIIDDLNKNPELQRIFGSPVAKSLVAVADESDLRIEEGGRVRLEDEEMQKFLEVLGEVIKTHVN